MYEKSRLQGGMKSVDVKEERKKVGMRSLNSLEDATKMGGLVMLFTLCWMGESPSLFYYGCG